MKKKYGTALIMVMLLAIAAGGCSSKKPVDMENTSDEIENVPDVESISDEAEDTPGTEENVPEPTELAVDTEPGNIGAVESEALFGGADIDGDVKEVTESGFNIVKTHSWEEGDGIGVSMVQVSGDTTEDEVTVSCGEGTVYQILTMDMASQTAVSLVETDKNSFASRDSVLVFGSCQDAKHYTADKVILIKWQ